NPRPSASKERHKPTLLMKLRRGRKSKKPRPSESASRAIEHFRLTMTEQDAAQIILIRSLEEIDPKTFPPSRLSEALAAAGSHLGVVVVVFDPGPLSVEVCSAPLWIHRSNGATSGRLDDRPLRPFLLIGLATNYLGFFTKIPILLNPQAAKPLDLYRFLARGVY